MTERTPVYTEDALARFRGTLSGALGTPDYWQRLPAMRLRLLLATVISPDFCRTFFRDEVAAVRAWAHDAPEEVDPSAVHQVATLFAQLVASELEKNSPPRFHGFGGFLQKLEQEVLPPRIADCGDRPLVLVLRGLSGCGKSTLAEILQRAGVAGHGPVGLLAGDIYHCKVGTEAKKSVYRTEAGQLVNMDPIFSEDPIGEVKALLWSDTFREHFQQLAAEFRLIVVDGGYGELLLDELGIVASQRVLIEVAMSPARRFEQVVARARHFQNPAAARVKIMNDIILSLGWYSVLMENSADPDWIVTGDESETVEQVLEQRSARGLELQPPFDKRILLQQLNIAREPGTPELSPGEFDQILAAVQRDPQVTSPEVLVNKNGVEIHAMLTAELQRQITIPQMQRITRHIRGSQPREQ